MAVKNNKNNNKVNVIVKSICFVIVMAEVILSALIVMEQQMAWGEEKIPIIVLFSILLCLIIWQTSKVLSTQFSSNNLSLTSERSLVFIMLGVGVGFSSLLLNLGGGPHALIAPVGLIVQLFFVYRAQKINHQT